MFGTAAFVSDYHRDLNAFPHSAVGVKYMHCHSALVPT